MGERTRRITTVHSGPHHTTREQTVDRFPEGSRRRVLAFLAYDDSAGHHSYDIVKDSVTIGRGGIAYPVDVRIASSSTSRASTSESAGTYGTGRFFLIDLSSLGTTLNGRHVPRGYDEVDGTQARERRRNAPSRPRAHRPCRHGVSRISRGGLMSVLLWSRFVLLAALVGLVACYVWAQLRDQRLTAVAIELSALNELPATPTPGCRGRSTRTASISTSHRGLFMVVDGIGGQAAGGKAADVAVAMLRTRLERETGPVADRVREAITVANNEIYRVASTASGVARHGLRAHGRGGRGRPRHHRPRGRYAALQAPGRPDREDHARPLAGRRA